MPLPNNSSLQYRVLYQINVTTTLYLSNICLCLFHLYILKLLLTYSLYHSPSTNEQLVMSNITVKNELIMVIMNITLNNEYRKLMSMQKGS